LSIEELLDMPVEDIAKMSDEELARWLSPYFPLTRPNKIPSAGSDISEEGFAPEVQAALDAVRAAQPKPLNLKALLNRKTS
jgi:hypothetical protein